jgi:carbon-monoxide dehydrogenase medium subunit
MKSPPFEYHRAETVDEALALLAEHGDEAKVLAGGQSLVPLLHLRLARPTHLVDINGLTDLASVRDGNGSGVELGAMVRHHDALASDVVRRAAPLVAAAIRLVGHAAIRNRGTVGGSVAHADPAAELPAALTALDGEVVARSIRGQRSIRADAFFTGFLTTTLEPDELLTAIRIPAWPEVTGWAFEEFSRRHGDFAIVGAASTVSLDAEGRVADARIALSGAGGVPLRAAEAEQLLAGEAPSPELWAAGGQRAAADVDPPADLHGTAAYRRQLVATLTKRALEHACLRATEAS